MDASAISFRRFPVSLTLTRIALAAGAILLVWALSNVVLLVLFAVLLAATLRGASDWVARRTGAPAQLVLALIAITVVVIAAALGYWIGPKLAAQGQDLLSRMTQQLNQLRQHFSGSPIGHAVSSQLSPSQLGGLLGPARTAISITLESLTYAVVLIVTLLYFAASPDLYLDGVLRLAPPARRPRVRQVLYEAGHVMQLWVLGQLIDMLVVGVLAALGLWLAGVPAAFALAVLAALFTFIPYLGAIVAGIPAVLVALTVGWSTALAALGVYVACHLVEGYLVAPLVQRRLIELPPALTVLAMTALGVLFGVFGVIVATPLTAAAIVLIREFYVADTLGDDQVRREDAPAPG